MAQPDYVGRKSNRGGAATKAELASAVIFARERAALPAHLLAPRTAIPLRAFEAVEYRFEYTDAYETIVRCVRPTGQLMSKEESKEQSCVLAISSSGSRSA